VATSANARRTKRATVSLAVYRWDAWLAARGRRDDDGVGRGAFYSATATGSRAAARKFVAPRRLTDHKLQVLLKEIAFVNEALSLLPHLFKVSSPARIAFRDRSAGIAPSYAFLRGHRGPGRRRRDGPASPIRGSAKQAPKRFGSNATRWMSLENPPDCVKTRIYRRMQIRFWRMSSLELWHAPYRRRRSQPGPTAAGAGR
jgi:hypothetical protein